MKFNDNRPIFLQIAERVQDQIIENTLSAGDRVPSTRELAIELAVNPATVMRAYDHLTEHSLIEQRRGLGYFVCQGAADRITSIRREGFFNQTLPELFAQMESLNIDINDVVSRYGKHRQEK